MDKEKNQFSVPGLLFAAACILEGYFLLEYRSLPLLVAAGGALVLAAAYAFMNGLWREYQKEREIKKEEQRAFIREHIEERWQDIEEIQKAMYVVIKRYTEDAHTDMEQLKEELEKGSKLSGKREVENIKAIEQAVKVLIKYNRMDAKKIAAFYKKQNDKVINAIQSGERIVPMGNMPKQQENDYVDTADGVLKDAVLENIGVEEPVEDEAAKEPIVAEAPEILEAQPEVAKEPEVDDPNKMMSPEDIAALLASTNAGEEPTALEAQPEVAKEPEVDDPNKMMSPEDIAALLASTNAGEEPTAEPVAEEPAASEAQPEVAKEPEMDDPNKMMSPEDIAALLASTNAETEPAVSEAQPEEEKQPEMDDPNKMMSPDDIAALLASMNQ